MALNGVVAGKVQVIRETVNQLRTLPLETLSHYLAQREDIAFAVLFGSSKDGVVRSGSDVDLGVSFFAKPDVEALAELMADIADILLVDDIDLVQVDSVNPILGFEAISGRFLCKNDRARTAEVCSLISREYEDAMVQLQRAG